MTFDDERRTLELAREWKEGRIVAVHPSIGRMLNCALTANGEDPVPFGLATNSQAPSLIDLIRGEYECAPRDTSGGKKAAARRFAHQLSASVHGRAHVGGG
jgi:hypothetical protein